jgi:hypothetical protein
MKGIDYVDPNSAIDVSYYPPEILGADAGP